MDELTFIISLYYYSYRESLICAEELPGSSSSISVALAFSVIRAFALYVSTSQVLITSYWANKAASSFVASTER
jgi:hypothetical protein